MRFQVGRVEERRPEWCTKDRVLGGAGATTTFRAWEMSQVDGEDEGRWPSFETTDRIVNVRELQVHIGEHVAFAESGAVVAVTRNGKIVARIVGSFLSRQSYLRKKAAGTGSQEQVPLAGTVQEPQPETEEEHL